MILKSFLAICLAACSLYAAAPQPVIDLRSSLRPSPIRSLEDGNLMITGTTSLAEGSDVSIRVTRSTGEASQTTAKVNGGKFACRFPGDFPDAAQLKPCLLYIDASSGNNLLEQRAEAMLIVSGNGKANFPDLPLSFSDDLIDAEGNKDEAGKTWPLHRTLVNHFIKSRGAKLSRIGRDSFDLAVAADFEFFKERVSIYDFDYRDADWPRPLNHRVARTFWQAEWDRWFGPGNDHPWDGNSTNRDRGNYRPYTFTNDLADLLVLYQMRRSIPAGVRDNRGAMVDEALSNLLALQYRGGGSFTLPQEGKRTEIYTAGAFRYGLFESGEWLTEGTGWFVNPDAGDHRNGGVFNGRSLWALGESLKADPSGKRAGELREAIELTLRFCLHDGLKDRYTKTIGGKFPLWMQAGEHGYLTLGMLAALSADPSMTMEIDRSQPERSLRDITAEALNALAFAVNADGYWTKYPDQDAMGLAALAEGAALLSDHPNAGLWKRIVIRAADGWVGAQVDPGERMKGFPNFGRRDGDKMTFQTGKDAEGHINLYITGLWLHALAKTYALTGDERYRVRVEAMIGYLCGDNSFHARLLNELGAVFNIVRDTGDENSRLGWDCYPESTAFVQIGLLHWLDAISSRKP